MSFRSYVFSAALAFAMGGATVTVMEPAAIAQNQALPADIDAALVASSGSISDLSTAAAQLIASNPGMAAQIVARAIELRPDGALQLTAIGAQIVPEQAASIAAAAAAQAPGSAAGIAAIAAASAPSEAGAITQAVSAVVEPNGVNAVAEVVAAVDAIVPDAGQESLIGSAAGGTSFTEGQIAAALANLSVEEIDEIVNDVNTALADAAAILAELEDRLKKIKLPKANSTGLSGS